MLVACALLATAAAPAQTVPEAGSLLHQGERAEPAAPAPLPAPLQLPSQPLPAGRAGARVHVNGFRIVGATLIPAAELQAQLAGLVGRELTLDELRRAALQLSDTYRRRGYFARALVPAQTVEGGVVEIEIVEGRLAAMRVETLPRTRLDPEWIRAVMESRQRSGEPLQPEAVQAALRNLDDVPGVFASGVIRPGPAAGQVDLDLRVEEGALVTGSATLDDYGMQATGAQRSAVDVALNDPSGRGDQLSAYAYASERSDYYRVAYSLPLGYGGWRAGPSAEHLDYRLAGSFNGFSGYADAGGLQASRPILRNSVADIAGAVELERRHFVNDSVGGINLSDKSISSITLRASGTVVDGRWGGATNRLAAAFTAGRLDLSANAEDLVADAAGPHTQGGFGKLELTLEREQTLPWHGTGLHASLNAQWAGHNLDAYERFTLGGSSGVRAYPAGQALGDQGWILSLELHRQFLAQLQGMVFVDAGGIDIDRDPYAGSTGPNRYELQGWGLGLRYAPSARWLVKAAVATRLGVNPGADANGNDIDGRRNLARFWLQGVFNFQL